MSISKRRIKWTLVIGNIVFQKVKVIYRIIFAVLKTLVWRTPFLQITGYIEK